MIRSKYAGGGKSHIATHFSKLGYNTLFVVPQNSLSQNIDDDAVTTIKFFSVPVGDGEKLPQFDHSDYNVVVFDETFMNGLHMLNRIRQFVNQNPNKIIVGAGDTKQLPPVEDLTNTRIPELIYCTVLFELELGTYSIVFERELRILSGGDTLGGGVECILIGGVGCVSTGNNTGRSSEPRELRDDDDELKTGGVSIFLSFTGWLLPDALLICLEVGTLPPSISNILSNILLNNDFCFSGCSCSCSASLLGLLDILLNSSFNFSICSISDLSELLLDEPDEELKLDVCTPLSGLSFIIIIFLSELSKSNHQNLNRLIIFLAVFFFPFLVIFLIALFLPLSPFLQK